MALNLAKITRILIQFTPWTGEARCAREFLARISGGKAVATNPDCDVTVRVRVKGSTFVEVEYANGEEERFDTPNMTAQVQQAVLAVFAFEDIIDVREYAQEVVRRISVRCEELETTETLQRVGIGKLESAWGMERYDSGKAEIVPPG